ncbi:hypothetical protein AB6G03_07220 [Providencia hangzhouensis]|uniref:hypothetical protein n=1 Tax=Providencia hangzhouensis TaxID=3031799 RepID=UPI0034DCF921
MDNNYNSFTMLKNMVSDKSKKEALLEVLPSVSKTEIDYFLLKGFIEFIEDEHNDITELFFKVIEFAEAEIFIIGQSKSFFNDW